MSKLDDILNNQQASSLHTGSVANVSGTKQEIKDLMLELIGEDVSVPSDYASPKSEMWQAMGRNREKRELRQEVENL